MSDHKPHLWRRSSASPDGSMTLVEHIQEFRRRLIISLIALCIGTIVGYIWYQNAPDFTIGGVHVAIPTLGEILREPYCAIPPEARADFSGDGTCKLLATGPFDMFILRMKIGALAGAVFSSPVWLGQLWGFITPGLYKNERRFSAIFITLAVILFTAGAVIAYYLLSVGLSFLLSIGSQTQTTALNGLVYYNFLLAFLVIFGFSFLVPLIIVMLNIMGVIHYSAVKDKRRIIIVGVFCFAAVATPGQDPFSMGVLGTALCLLVECSFQFCRINDKRRTTKRADWLDVDDSQPSPIETAPGPIVPPTTIRPPSGYPPSSPSQMPRKPDPSGPAPSSPNGFDDVV